MHFKDLSLSCCSLLVYRNKMCLCVFNLCPGLLTKSHLSCDTLYCLNVSRQKSYTEPYLPSDSIKKWRLLEVIRLTTLGTRVGELPASVLPCVHCIRTQHPHCHLGSEDQVLTDTVPLVPWSSQPGDCEDNFCCL
jgi:hypothetical protein